MLGSVCYICLISLLFAEFSDGAGDNSQENLPFERHHLEVSNSSYHHCLPWSYFDSAKQMCSHDIYYATDFFDNSTFLRVGYCTTYDEASGIVSFSPCPYFQPTGYVVHGTKKSIWYIKLPNNISVLNNYMCGPMHRRGRVCSECKDGFGLAVTSVGFNIQCSNCTNVWYAISLYLFLEFVPVTIFYLIILIFQVNITSAPMTCYIMYSQLVALWWSSAFDGEDFNVSKQMFILNSHTELFRKIVLSMYDVWNLRFFHYLVPPFCISSQLKPFHLGLLGYISIFYPLFLIALTWTCIRLHDRNFKLIVWLWRPLHECFVPLRRGWDPKSDIIDVFTSFFLLSFSKVMYQAALFMSFQTIQSKHYENLGILVKKTFVTNIDLMVTYGSTEHLLLAMLSVLVFCILNLLPTLLLIFYPIKYFQTCLSKCRLDGMALNVKFFVERFYSSYKDVTHGGKDMRGFAALYFVLRPIIFVAGSVVSLINVSNMDPYLPRNIIFIVASLLVALCRPYKKTYMNVLDTLLLAHFGLFCHLISSYHGFEIRYHSSFVYTFEIVLAAPLVVFLVILAFSCLRKARNSPTFSQKCKYFCWTMMCDHRRNSEKRNDSSSSEQPLIESTHIENNNHSYGAIG